MPFLCLTPTAPTFLMGPLAAEGGATFCRCGKRATSGVACCCFGAPVLPAALGDATGAGVAATGLAMAAADSSNWLAVRLLLPAPWDVTAEGAAAATGAGVAATGVGMAAVGSSCWLAEMQLLPAIRDAAVAAGAGVAAVACCLLAAIT
eukprot:CAMPEP_0202886102 /NCGR_PEP_ID=MMETSP1391-20130828/42006_1 /ASSEMBLY_ACC=CAM_ASM_000867 /TAXON_ID=1034604 /ORGANISM="Chlamydomonas leiostraca, Strain SAG 11-49" /LENGTH=148 /DNA_ID=CAMNT_0049569367 /DNA_START=32 /DNA_END=478 /DNA_ORIENTATION=+